MAAGLILGFTAMAVVVVSVAVQPLALLGNLIGGSLFVAALNYAHIRKSRERQNS